MSDNSVAVDACTEAELALQSYLDGVITQVERVRIEPVEWADGGCPL